MYTCEEIICLLLVRALFSVSVKKFAVCLSLLHRCLKMTTVHVNVKEWTVCEISICHFEATANML